MTFLAVGGYVVSLWLLIAYFAKREAALSSLAIFGLSAFLYYVSIPLEVAIGGIDFFLVSSFVVDIPPAVQWRIVVMGTMALWGFAFGYWASGFRLFAGRAHPRVSDTRALPRHLIVLVGGALTVVVAFFGDKIASVSTYAGNYATVYSSPLYSLLTEIAAVGLAVWSATVAHRSPRLSIALLFLIVGWGVYSSDKDPILFAILSFATRFVWPDRRMKWRLLFGALVVMLLAGPLLSMFSIYRAERTVSLADVAVTSFMLGKDPTGPMVSLVETVSNRQIDYQLGATYVTGLTALVPRALWPDRPLDLSEAFIRERMQSSWRPGQGLAYSLLAEAYLNFGWLGPLVQFTGMGLVWGLAWKFVQRSLLRLGFRYWRAVYCTVGYYTLIVMHRSPTSFPVKHSLMIVGTLMLSQIFFRQLAPSLLPRDPFARPSLPVRT